MSVAPPPFVDSREASGRSLTRRAGTACASSEVSFFLAVRACSVSSVSVNCDRRSVTWQEAIRRIGNTFGQCLVTFGHPNTGSVREGRLLSEADRRKGATLSYENRAPLCCDARCRGFIGQV
eukprot:6105045-Pyramimonas_sp.AAC.1